MSSRESYICAALSGILSRTTQDGLSTPIATAISLSIDCADDLIAQLKRTPDLRPRTLDEALDRTPDDDHGLLQAILKERDSLIVIVKETTADLESSRDAMRELQLTSTTLRARNIALEAGIASLHTNIAKLRKAP